MTRDETEEQPEQCVEHCGVSKAKGSGGGGRRLRAGPGSQASSHWPQKRWTEPFIKPCLAANSPPLFFSLLLLPFPASMTSEALAAGRCPVRPMAGRAMSGISNDSWDFPSPCQPAALMRLQPPREASAALSAPTPSLRSRSPMALLIVPSVQLPWPVHVLNRGTTSWKSPLSHSHHIPTAQPSANSKFLIRNSVWALNSSLPPWTLMEDVGESLPISGSVSSTTKLG